MKTRQNEVQTNECKAWNVTEKNRSRAVWAGSRKKTERSGASSTKPIFRLLYRGAN
jgi:hypothetical protein